MPPDSRQINLTELPCWGKLIAYECFAFCALEIVATKICAWQLIPARWLCGALNWKHENLHRCLRSMLLKNSTSSAEITRGMLICERLFSVHSAT
ncbi:hypothetical protein SLE2022_004920 [Rubroshorea leprosula]